VPGLYNVGDSPFYFHGACKNTLDDVIDYKLKAISENSKASQEDISSKFLPRTLTLREKEQLIMFIKEGLRDPDLLRFKPTKVVSGSCFPNADELSIYVLGCN
ncbi:MAG: cytochrome c peroxidase, partial [Saprospiraceae bacterium]